MKHNQAKKIWFEVTKEMDRNVLEQVCQMNYQTILVNSNDLEIVAAMNLPQHIKLAVVITSLNDLKTLKNASFFSKISFLITESIDLLREITREPALKAGLLMKIDDKVTLEKAAQLVKSVELMIIEFKDPTNIPLELMLATAQNSPCQIYKKVTNARDGEVSLLIMETGADGLVLSTSNVKEIRSLDKIIQRVNEIHFELKEAIVKKIKPTGMGTRVCIDTTSELTQDEGMLLGSTSSGGLLICSETHYLPYMNLRTFRVNAGGVHLYVWGPDDRVGYLSDLRAGDKVVVVNSHGNARAVTIGRLKIETRPLLLIECEIEGVSINVFIQDDWHVRIFGSDGAIRPSSEIKINDKLLGYLDQPGRHVGLRIDETIKEV
jgi:3-amino-4-hydroxybenzoic acid synthase